MFKKILTTTIFSLFIASTFLTSVEYEIQDIGTLQTHSSQAIAINNQGQVLGWYNIDGSSDGLHYFLRDKDGTFHEIPKKVFGVGIYWNHLTNNGKIYGIVPFEKDKSSIIPPDLSPAMPIGENNKYAMQVVDHYNSSLYMYDPNQGAVKIGDLPSNQIVAINDKGQVLIKAVKEARDGKTMCYPIIWDNGNIIKLNRLESEAGIESPINYGLAMNNEGDVVGKSVVYLVYKNKLYPRYHAVKWVDGKAQDIHNLIPKCNDSSAEAINNERNIIINGEQNGSFLCYKNSLIDLISSFEYGDKLTNSNLIFHSNRISDCKNKDIASSNSLCNLIRNDRKSIWNKIKQLNGVNDSGEIIAQGITIYGEQHAILLTPIKAE